MKSGQIHFLSSPPLSLSCERERETYLIHTWTNQVILSAIQDIDILYLWISQRTEFKLRKEKKNHYQCQSFYLLISLFLSFSHINSKGSFIEQALSAWNFFEKKKINSDNSQKSLPPWNERGEVQGHLLMISFIFLLKVLSKIPKIEHLGLIRFGFMAKQPL